MRKYGRPVDHGDGVRLVDVVEVPSAIADPMAWLGIMFQDKKEEWAKEWFIACPDDACSGMPYVNGKFGEPPQPSEAAVVEATTKDELLAKLKDIAAAVDTL